MSNCIAGRLGNQFLKTVSQSVMLLIYFPFFEGSNEGIEEINTLKIISSFPCTSCLCVLNSITPIIYVTAASRLLLLCSWLEKKRHNLWREGSFLKGNQSSLGPPTIFLKPGLIEQY